MIPSAYDDMSNVRAQRKGMNKMISVMVLAFVVAWLPYSIMALINVFDYKCIISTDVAVSILILAKSSICYNPIIYAYFNRDVSAIPTKCPESLKSCLC